MNYFQQIKDKTKYQELLGKALFRTFFHGLDWEEFLEKEFKWLKFEHYLYKDEAIFSLARYNFLGKEKLVSHPFCEYGGLLPLRTNISGRELKINLFEEFKLELKIKFHPEIPKYFQEFGLKEPESMNDAYFIEDIDKKNVDQVYSSFRKTLKHSIKKAENEKIKLEKCKNQNDLRLFYNLYLKNIQRHKTIAYPFSFFKYFLNSSNAEIILAKYENKIIAGSVFLFYDKFVHYFLNASDYNYRNKKSSYLILWNQIKNCLQKQHKIFDLGGTGRNSQLEVFKRGWGTRKYTIFELKNFEEGKIKTSKLRNVFGFLPSFLFEKISPYFLKYKL
jgi:hypothetical protein